MEKDFGDTGDQLPDSAAVAVANEETQSHLQYSHIMDLPEELRGKIFNFCPQEEAARLRLVCKQWCSEVDRFYDFDGVINDEIPAWERVLDLRLVSCKIARFYKNPPNYGLPATRIFKYPHLLRRLDINHQEQLNISPENFYYILLDYGSSVTELNLYLNIPILIADFSPSPSMSSFNLQNLVKLELTASITSFSDVGGGGSPNGGLQVHQLNSRQNAFDQLMRNPMSSLRYAKLELRLVGDRTISKFLASVFVFLASRSKNSGAAFQELDFQLIQGHHGLPPAQRHVQEPLPLNDVDSEFVDLRGFGQLVSLKHLRIVSSSSIGVGLWLDLLLRQTSLISLEVDVIPASHHLFSSVISNNYSSLVQLEITDLTIWVVPVGEDAEDRDPQPVPFDLTILQPCTSLKRLILDRNVMARREFDCAELVNLINLPNCLEELALNFFNVFTNDFYLYFSSLKLLPECNLTNVAITQCGSSGDYGVNGSVLEMLLSLKSVLFVEISRLNFGGDSNCTESIKLNRILTSFGYRENHSYFQCMKVLASPDEQEQATE